MRSGSDFTYLRGWEGGRVLQCLIDAYSRRVIGWQFARTCAPTSVPDALRMALTRRAAGADIELVHHSDAGSYTSYAFAQVLDDHGVLASIGSVGDEYANAMAESFKTELIADRICRNPHTARTRDRRARRLVRHRAPARVAR